MLHRFEHCKLLLFNMQDSDRQTRSHLMKLFERHGFHPRHDLGQNFLIDLNIIDFIVAQADLSRDDVVLEIGTGTGGMTTFMAREAAHVISVDVDQNMHRLATEVCSQYSNITLLNRDALKNKNTFAPEVLSLIQEQLDVDPDRRFKLVSNLPYSIATPVISNLVATNLPWQLMVVTIQYELGLRMRSEPRDSHYGSLSVWLQSQCAVKMIKKLGPTVFWPRPKVESAIMKITPDATGKEQIVDRPFFQDYVRRAFNLRRKLLRGVLCGMYRQEVSKEQIDTLMSDAGLGLTTRAEELDIKSHVNLANRLYALVQWERSRAVGSDPKTSEPVTNT